MRLHCHPISTTSRPILLFAADSGIALDVQVVDLFTGEQLQPAFSAINPSQQVPVLDDGDFRLTESSAILKYLADKIGSPAYPAGLRDRARVNERMDWLVTGLSRDLCYGFIYPQIFPSHKRPDDAAQAAALAWGRERATRWLKILDEHLIGPRDACLAGDRISLADYLGIAMLTLGEAVHIDYSRWRNISRFIAAMKARPSWSAVNEPFYTHVVGPMASASFATL
jgi:glutathione S-transferase